GGFSRPKMLKENQERIAWFDNPTERMKHTGQAIRDAAEKGGYGYRWWKANDIEHNEGYNTANAFAHGAPERSQFLEGTTRHALGRIQARGSFIGTDLWITSLSAK